jgi:hypothetical protein
MAGRDLTFLVIVGLGVLYFAMAFAVAWLRASPAERQRWDYRGRHDGGGGLLPDLPRDPADRQVARRLYLVSVALALGGVAGGAGLIRAGLVTGGVVVFGIATVASGVLKVAYLRRVGLTSYSGGHRTGP